MRVMKLEIALKQGINSLTGRIAGFCYLSGVYIPWYGDIYSAEIKKALTRGYYERAEAKILKKVIDGNETILELGTAIGFISAFASKFTNAEKIECVEANPQLIPIIKKTHQINRVTNVEVLNVVATNDENIKNVDFYCREDFWSSSLSQDDRAIKVSKVVQVQTIMFHELCEKYRPEILVMDIEGGELDVIINANLGGINKVIMELHPWVYGKDGIHKMFAKLSDNQFVYDPKSSNGKVVVFTRM